MTRGFLATLDSLRPASGIDPDRAREIFKGVESNQNHIIVVAEAGGQVVGTATLLIEQKFIHDGGMAGHIEDVAVRDGFRDVVLAGGSLSTFSGLQPTGDATRQS